MAEAAPGFVGIEANTISETSLRKRIQKVNTNSANV